MKRFAAIDTMKQIADLEEQERKALKATERAYNNFKRKQSVLLAVHEELKKLGRARRRATAKGELAKLLVRLKSDLPT